MSKTELFYAYCIAISFLSLVWLFFGGPGVLLSIASAIAGAVRVDWIDDLEERRREPEPVPAPEPARVPDANHPHRAVAWKAVPIPLPKGAIAKPMQSPLRPRRYPPNVVRFPRKVS